LPGLQHSSFPTIFSLTSFSLLLMGLTYTVIPPNPQIRSFHNQGSKQTLIKNIRRRKIASVLNTYFFL
jgi:hypothetical protein